MVNQVNLNILDKVYLNIYSVPHQVLKSPKTSPISPINLCNEGKLWDFGALYQYMMGTSGRLFPYQALLSPKTSPIRLIEPIYYIGKRLQC